MIEIVFTNISVTLQGKRILDNVTATITESCAIVGESGSGKTTLAKVLLGLVPYTGTVAHNDLRMTLIPQDPATALHPLKTIATHFNEICPLQEQLPLLKAMGFIEPLKILRSYPHQLSGGMKQRILIALALATKPDFLIADEPTTGLDTIVQRQIIDLLATLQVPLLLITHDERIARRLCPTEMILENGKVAYFGATHAAI